MCGTSTVLPVEWMSFEIISGSSGRELHWATATEENSDFFEVQVSENGVDFEPIGRLDAAGNSSNTRNYSFLHAEKLFEDAYYRIREVDFDGKSSLSEIRFVQAVKTGGMLVFPNPVKSDVVRMSVAGTAGTVCKVMLLDATGRKVFDNSLELKEHHSTDLNFELPPGIESGCYSLLAIVGSEIWSERLMIQR
jgi:hypothetical protein